MIVGTGPYQTAIADLRMLLSDGADDRYVYQARCFGRVDGVNVAFKTFYRRRSTNFTTGASGGVYVDSVLLPASGVISDNQETGEFVVAVPPTNAGSASQIVEASYFYQWFNDDELDTFLQISSRWLVGTNDYTTTQNALIDALLKYASAEAYLKMAQRWRTYMSQEYKVEDAPKDSPTYNTNDFLKLSTTFREEALASRTEFMQTRQGRALQPLSGRITGRVRNLP